MIFEKSIILLLAIFNLCYSLDEWGEFIYEEDYEIKLIANVMNLKSTSGLKYHAEITWLEMGGNELFELGEISYLANLKYRDLT